MNHKNSSFLTYLKLLENKYSDHSPKILENSDAITLLFNPLATQSVMLKGEPEKLALSYTRSMMGFLLLHPAPARISMIGLGGGSLLKYCYRYLPHTKVVGIEVDPAVIALRDVFQIPPDDDRLEIVCADGAEYVKCNSGKPDVILVDGYLANGMPSRLGDATFYAECFARLIPSGILVANFLDDDPRIPRYLEAARMVFGMSLSIFLSDDSCNYLLFAWKGEPNLPSQAELRARACRLSEDHPLTNLASSARLIGQGKQLASDHAFWEKFSG